jgi:MFS family permease
MMTDMQRDFKLLAFAALINGTCFSMILPLLAPLTRQLHLSEFQGGVIVSAGAIFMAIASIWMVKQKNNYSSNQLIQYGFWGMTFTWAIFTFILYLGIHALLPTLVIFLLLVISRASTGVFMALPQIGLQSYVMTQSSEVDTRTKNMALLGAMNSFGMIIGPFATSVLLFGGLLFPMWIAVGTLGILSIALAIIFNQKNNIQHNLVDQQNNDHEDDQSILKPSFIWLLLGFSTYVAIVTLNMTAGFYIQDKFGLNSQQSAMYFTQCMLVVGVSLVLTQLLIVKFFKFKIQSLVLIGISTMILGLLISLYAPTIIIFQTSYIVYGISVACLLPAFTTGAAQAVSAHAQVKMASYCTTTQAIGLIVGPLLSTALYQSANYLPFIFLLIANILLASYFLWKFMFSTKVISTHIIAE